MIVESMKQITKKTVGIYKITNKQRGKHYIGSSNNIYKRWWEHRKWLRLGNHANVHLQRAWIKYGEDSFTFEVIEKCSLETGLDTLKQLEQTYLDKMFKESAGMFYNIAKTADRPDANNNKISVLQVDPKTNEVVSTFSSIEEAGQAVGMLAGNIGNCCRGIAMTAGGYRWKYADPQKASEFQEKQGEHGGHGRKSVCKIDPKTGNVVETYASIAEAAEKNGCKTVHIFSVLNGSRKTTKGLVFAYTDQPSKILPTTGCTCKICGVIFESYSKSFSTHLQMTHKLSSESYTIQYLTEFGQRPTCHSLGCMTPVRYVAFTFKEFCKNHSKLAMSKGGKVGGCAPAWNQGLTKDEDNRLLKQSLLFKGEHNPFFGHKHTEQSKELISKNKTLSNELFNQRLSDRSAEFIVSTSYDNYTSRQRTPLNMSCVVCGFKTTKTLQSFERGSLCKKCHPFTVSKAELEILDYVKGLGFELTLSGNRQLIAPLELDIVVPEKNFAVEYHGLYWHQDKKDLHLDKFEACKAKGIRLIQVFSDEWLTHNGLIKSMIANRLGVSNTAVGARRCSVVEVTHKEATKFFEHNHISGHTLSKKIFGLKFNNELICCLSLRVPRHKQYVAERKIEIARLATKQGCVVQGGFSKLLKHAVAWVKGEGFKTLMSYCDLRFGEGNVYLKNGFTLVKQNTGVNYWYTDGVQRYDRFKFRAQPGKSEALVAEEAKVHKIYGCGNSLYEMTL